MSALFARLCPNVNIYVLGKARRGGRRRRKKREKREKRKEKREKMEIRCSSCRKGQRVKKVVSSPHEAGLASFNKFMA